MILIVLTGCDRASKPEPSQPSVAKAPTIASLVPAATDLVRGMGAGEHLVAVSNYDQDAGGLPKVGDYQTIDWEKLAQIRPSCIVTQYGTGHNPPGFVERARELNIKQVNVRFDRLDDVFKMISVLGDACDESAAAAKESKEIRDALDEVHHRVEGLPPVRTIIVTGSSGMELAGTGTYLDDLLRQAGGDNAVTSHGYVTLDRESIMSLHPDAVLILMPGADVEAAEKARAAWNSYSDMPAVKKHHVWAFTESSVMQPGSRVAQVAQQFADVLHPHASPASQSATSRTSP
ncbi:MAG TPA: ABC transporter substrate-binding protein [Tepidisphaeraceae bacterium]|nr:ABC transporter substrate-binding protein [Tepidisphaeraceae bacterium]